MRKILLTISALLLLAAPALANMDGCWGEIVGPAYAEPGDTVTFVFNIQNGSADGEMTNVVVIRFPEIIHISEGWFDDLGQGWSFDFETGGEFSDYGYFSSEVGQIAPGTGGLFYLTVYISPNMDCETFDIRWKQYGDRTGEPDHWIGEYLSYNLCETPTETSSWSLVKSIY